MKATVHLSVVCAGLALAGCKTAKTITIEDAAPPSDDVANQDTAAPEPDLAAPAPDLAAPAPDLAAPAPDVATIADAARDTTSSSVDMSTFCTGGASKMVVNGISSTPTVTGKVVPYDCCQGAEFDVVTATFDQPIVVTWKATAGAFAGYSTIDLANPPTGWSLAVLAGCASASGCATPADSYTSGLGGKLSVMDGKSSLYDMSVCLHVEESTSSPHAVIHSLDLFATHVEAK